MTRRRAVAGLAAATSAAVLLALGGCTNVAAPDDGTNYVGGAGIPTSYTAAERVAAPELAGPTLEGSRLDVASLKGKVVVLNFWGSWCGPCRSEAPALGRVAKALAGQGVQFVGINTKENDASQAKAFLETMASERQGLLAYPNLVDDPSNPYAVRFNGTVPPAAIPSTIVLDRSGRVAARIIGETDEKQLTGLLAPLVAEKA